MSGSENDENKENGNDPSTADDPDAKSGSGGETDSSKIKPPQNK